jgi:Zn-dependent peptidase ImmA (M78 family)
MFINEIGLTIRRYDNLQEAEADWLGGTLLLPRDVLVQCYFRQYSIEDACRLFGVSSALFNYRMNISGVRKQFSRSRSRR